MVTLCGGLTLPSVTVRCVPCVLCVPCARRPACSSRGRVALICDHLITSLPSVPTLRLYAVCVACVAVVWGFLFAAMEWLCSHGAMHTHLRCGALSRQPTDSPTPPPVVQRTHMTHSACFASMSRTKPTPYKHNIPSEPHEPRLATRALRARCAWRACSGPLFKGSACCQICPPSLTPSRRARRARGT